MRFKVGHITTDDQCETLRYINGIDNMDYIYSLYNPHYEDNKYNYPIRDYDEEEIIVTDIFSEAL